MNHPHTPPPWFVDDGGVYSHDIGLLFAHAWRGLPTEQTRVDADEALIAAAPEMYEALKLCAVYLGEIDTSSEDWGDPEAWEAHRAARRAIAKAEGRDR